MSLLPAAMRLPNDITPLGKKVVPPAPPAKPDPVKAFEKLSHPFPDGSKSPAPSKPFFGFDYATGPDESMVTIYRKMADEVREDVYQQAFPALVKQIVEKTATEMMLKQREAEQSMRAQRTPDWFDLDREVDRAVKRSGAKVVNIVRSVKSAFGGDVRKDQIESAINYVRAMYR